MCRRLRSKRSRSPYFTIARRNVEQARIQRRLREFNDLIDSRETLGAIRSKHRRLFPNRETLFGSTDLFGLIAILTAATRLWSVRLCKALLSQSRAKAASMYQPSISILVFNRRARVGRRIHHHGGDDVTRCVTKHLLALARVFGGDG